MPFDLAQRAVLLDNEMVFLLLVGLTRTCEDSDSKCKKFPYCLWGEVLVWDFAGKSCIGSEDHIIFLESQTSQIGSVTNTPWHTSMSLTLRGLLEPK
jgi:hypothetical protein